MADSTKKLARKVHHPFAVVDQNGKFAGESLDGANAYLTDSIDDARELAERLAKHGKNWHVILVEVAITEVCE